jgi:hypothetical protein
LEPDIVEKDTNDNVVLLSKKAIANRRNSQLSTGPKTEVGKKHSRLNAIRHGVLASALVVIDGNWEYHGQFEKLVSDLARDLEPVGTLEEMLVNPTPPTSHMNRKISACLKKAI